LMNLDFISKTFDLRLGKLEISPTYWQAAAIVFLLFLLVLTLARLRHMYIDWSVSKSAIAFMFWGFILAIIIEGFFIIGGRTIVTEFLGWKNPPKPVKFVLEAGRGQLVRVLGLSDEIPEPKVSLPVSYQSIISDYQGLSSQDAGIVRSFICSPRED